VRDIIERLTMFMESDADTGFTPADIRALAAMAETAAKAESVTDADWLLVPAEFRGGYLASAMLALAQACYPQITAPVRGK
jgi:hypothetical protein